MVKHSCAVIICTNTSCTLINGEKLRVTLTLVEVMKCWVMKLSHFPLMQISKNVAKKVLGHFILKFFTEGNPSARILVLKGPSN